MSDGSDVIVVGGGAVGACCALELARAGASVTVLERGAELAWACSRGNMGMICPGHSAPIASSASLKLGLRNLLKPDGAFYLKPDPTLLPWLARFTAACRPEQVARGVRVMRELSVASLDLHASLADEGLETTFTRRGLLNVAETEDGLAELAHEGDENATAGLRVETLGADEVRELQPVLGPSIVGGVYYPDEAHCDSAVFVRAVGAAAEAAGARIRTRVEVLRLLHTGARVHGVETTQGRLVADAVVLAAGAWTPKLAEQAGVFVPITGGKGYHVELPPEPSMPTMPMILYEARVGVTPLAGRLRIGGTLELSGLDESISPRRVDAIVEGATRALPGLAGRPRQKVWRGLRPCAPDGVPIVGESRRMANLVVASGHAHMGLALAPITGRLVRQIVRREEPSHALDALSPDRFQPLV